MKRLIIGVLLAAGRSRRMGQLKQLMPWPNNDDPNAKPMVAAAYDSIAAVCDKMIVVTGTQAKEIVEALSPRDFQEAWASVEDEMMNSVRIGLAHAFEIENSADVLLQLGDHPQVQPATLQSMLAMRTQHPDKVIIPEFGGRGGHPVLIPPEFVFEIGTASSQAAFPDGLRGLWLSRPEDCLRFDTSDDWVTRDFDTPADMGEV